MIGVPQKGRRVGAVGAAELLRSGLLAPSPDIRCTPSPPPSPAPTVVDVPFLSGPLVTCCCKAAVSVSVPSPTPTRLSLWARAFAIWPKSLLVVMSGANSFGFWFMPSSTMASVRAGQFLVRESIVEQRMRAPRQPFRRQAFSKSPGQGALCSQEVAGRHVGQSGGTRFDIISYTSAGVCWSRGAIEVPTG